MITETVEVSSKGTVIGKVEVQKFESLTEAKDFFINQFPGDAEATIKGEKEVLDLINAQYRANVTNAERVRLTRGVSPMKALREKVKSDPKAKALLESVLAELGIDASQL